MHLQSTGKEISRQSIPQRARCLVCVATTSVNDISRHPLAEAPRHALLASSESRPSLLSRTADFFEKNTASDQRALAVRLASLHPGPTTVSREPCSLLQASGVSSEYLLLSPKCTNARSSRVYTRPSPHHLRLCVASAYSLVFSQVEVSHKPRSTSTPLSVIHFRGYPTSASQLLRTA
jgi:hypothetical protein